jgi:hypothetical protein
VLFIAKICALTKGNYEGFLPKADPGSGGINRPGYMDAAQNERVFIAGSSLLWPLKP